MSWTSYRAAAVCALACVLALPAAAQVPPSDGGRTGVRMPGRRDRPAPTPPAPVSAAPVAAAAATPAATAPSSPPSKLEVQQTSGGTKMISMEVYGYDIDHILRLLSKEAGVTIVKSKDVSGEVTIIAPEPVPLDVAFQILDSVLQVRGFTMTRAATGIYKVVSVDAAIRSGVPVEFGARPEDVPSGDSYVTQVIPLTNLDANDVLSRISGLLSGPANAIPTSTNSLIITDTAGNIQKILTIIADAESQLSGGFQVIPLQYYSAEEMAGLVTYLILSRGGAGGAAGRPVLPYERRLTQRQPAATAAQRGLTGAGGIGPEFCYPDARTNSLIVLATPLHLQQVRELVEQLDRPISLRDSFFVYPVRNLVASDLAQTVGPLIGAQVSGRSAGPTGGGASAAPAAGRGLATPSGATFRSGVGSIRSRSSSAEPGRPDRLFGLADEALEVEPTAGAAGSGGGEPPPIALPGEGVQILPIEPQPAVPPIDVFAPILMEEGQTVVPAGVARQAAITADDNTNILLVAGTPEQIELAQQLFEKLDIPPPQVYIRAIIAEVSLGRTTSLGFQWQNLGRTFGKLGGNTYTGDIGTNFGLFQTDATGNFIPSSGFFGQLSGPEFEAVIAALTTDFHARILSTPSIFTSNNQRARIDVSSRRPFPRGTLTTTTGTGQQAAVSTSIDYESVGIVLEVTPRVTQGDVVQMEVTVSADEPGPAVNIAGQDYPSVSRRQTQGTPSCKHGYTIVLGGLMRDTISRTSSRVPILGDLPIVGSLFRSSTSKREKSELLIFLTPQVIRTPGEAAAVTEAEKSRLGEVPRSLKAPADGSAPAPSK